MDRKKRLLDTYGIRKEEEPVSVQKEEQISEETASSGKRRIGRKPSVASLGRDGMQVTIRLYGNNKSYCLHKAQALHIEFGELSSIINMLIDEDRRNNPQWDY